MSSTAYDWIDQSLKTLHKADWERTVETLSGRAGPVMTWQGKPVVNFASNDYLGLAGVSRLAAAAIAAIHNYGTGSTGSRLLSGHRDLHRQLEQAIATWKDTEDAIVFSSGYLANIGTISALVGPRDLILTDQYNHSSLISGAQLSGATVLTYQHCDQQALQRQLAAQRSHYRRGLIITDSVFSMDGDLCPLPAILDLAAAWDCMVLVDEAHGTGVFGPTGSGVVAHCGCRHRPLIQMGTLSKALGSLGGYVTGAAEVIDFLRNRAPSWIYTTGLTPADTAAALAAVELVQTEPQRRDRLWHNVHTLSRALRSLVDDSAADLFSALLPSESPILCLEVADAKTAVRLGMTVMATHEPGHIQQLITALQQLAQA